MVDYMLSQMKYPEQKGLVSVIVPIYNNEANVKECLDSILAQKFTNWEAILVNDGSTDCTGKIIDEYAEKNSQFIAIHKQNEGTLLAKKTGLENSKGEFIATIDHDDTYDSQFLEKMHEKITETNSDFVWCKCQVEEKNSLYYMSDYEWSANANENVAKMMIFCQGMSWMTWNKLIRRKIYAKVHFPNVHMVLGEDPVQMLQVAYYSKSTAFVSKSLYFHNLVSGFSTKSTQAQHFAAMSLVKKTLKYIFNGAIPDSVKESFYSRINIYHYFLLDKKTKTQIREEIEPLIPELMKREKNVIMKICLFLANKGIIFPVKIKEWVKHFIICGVWKTRQNALMAEQ